MKVLPYEHRKRGAQEIVMRALDTLKPYGRNPRVHYAEQVQLIADSITRFGFSNPILLDGDSAILAGHGRLLAARLLGMAEVPTIDLRGLSPSERRAYVLADNQLATRAGWSPELLASEIDAIVQAGEVPIGVLGFSDEELTAIERIGALDQESPVVREPRSVKCPECGHEFNPSERQ